MATTSQQALQDLQKYQSSRKSAQDILSERETSLGTPTSQQRLVGLRGAISNTENLLKGVDPSVSGRTQGSLVTEAQKQRLISLEREPIAGQLSDQNRALGDETANYNTLSARALQDAQLSIADQESRQNSLQGIYSTLYQQEQDAAAKAAQERAYKQQVAEANRNYQLAMRQIALDERKAAAEQALYREYLKTLAEPVVDPTPSTPKVSLDSIFGKTSSSPTLRVTTTNAGKIQPSGNVVVQNSGARKAIQATGKVQSTGGFNLQGKNALTGRLAVL